jgi:hypothetical protein
MGIEMNHSPMNAALPPEQLEKLRRIDACTPANAIETFHF